MDFIELSEDADLFLLLFFELSFERVESFNSAMEKGSGTLFAFDVEALAPIEDFPGSSLKLLIGF